MNIQKLKDILIKNQDSRSYQDINSISVIISNVKFFESLKETKSIFNEVCKYLTYEYFETNKFIFNEGEIGDKFYIILKGQVGVLIKIKEKENFTYKEVFAYDDGGSFGELALTENKPRAASILTKSECHLAVLDKTNYNRILASMMKKKRNDQVDFLQSQAIFQKLTKGSLWKLSYCFEELILNKDKILFVEGQKIEYLYLIKEGEVKISRSIKINLIDTNEPLTKKNMFMKRYYKHRADISILGKGELIGVYDIETGIHSVTCKCISNVVKLIAISIGDFKKRINQEEPLKFLNSGKFLKESMRENSIKSITKIAKDRVISPDKRILFEKTVSRGGKQPLLTKQPSKFFIKDHCTEDSLEIPRSRFNSMNVHRKSKNPRKLTQEEFSLGLIGSSFDSTMIETLNPHHSILEDFPNNSTSKRVKSSFTRSREKYNEKRPNTSSLQEDPLSITGRAKSAANKSYEHGIRLEINVSLHKETSTKKSFKTLLNHIMPFGRSKIIKFVPKEETVVNIHTQRKKHLVRNRDPAHFSFRSIRISPPNYRRNDNSPN